MILLMCFGFIYVVIYVDYTIYTHNVLAIDFAFQLSHMTRALVLWEMLGAGISLTGNL